MPNNPSRDVLLALRERVLAAKGADVLTCAHLIAETIAPAGSFVSVAPVSETVRVCTRRGAFTGADIEWAAWPSWRSGFKVNPLETSIVLFERMLPGWSRENGKSGFGNPAWCRAWNPSLSPRVNNEVRSDHNGGSEPLAICAALLTALAGGQTHG
ncbi:hypothetical protein [Methylobacterium thuringiense]|uniref:DUF2591 domain-containing protein n=1 Tax=Methylobacterium thuringiense TaxID=1003091 RepID=A0ABQ4TJV4_9HYPH|nr:hypothetical protein [Methylobacterium thuringiense]GJE54529.1 hypothetical protein EKPJFOCH_1007 [Methylobacterium thuringiense]